ncbi:hypothetical protein NUW54_g6160 [Trametes sanguinea]|uniref:Uncharacterized protein n=1 Tax=Trametes sanguinea TaxID=158606 RepID=A0ACC1PVR9_9APHY|nr:hypothetical protein NUW54_g6160 [Trametes sanguinea]
MVQSKLFSAFNQTEQGRLQGGKGTGLGLALVRQIVKLSGGRLGVQSKVGEGSTFWVELQELEQDDYPSPRQPVYSSTRDVAPRRDGASNVRSSFQFNQSHSSSALHSIMEQAIACRRTGGDLDKRFPGENLASTEVGVRDGDGAED